MKYMLNFLPITISTTITTMGIVLIVLGTLKQMEWLIPTGALMLILGLMYFTFWGIQEIWYP